MPERRYLLLDVFASKPLEGNPLAIVIDCEGLDTARMQAIAREFNLSETVFVLPAETSPHAARIRIFTPDYEMPFAGHPTVGTAVALAGERGLGDGEILVLEENIGPVRCVARHGADADFAEFDLPRLPDPVDCAATTADVAAALGLTAADIGFGNHRISAWSAGVPYVIVPVKGLAAMRRIAFDTNRWRAIAPRKTPDAFASAYVYCRETVSEDCAFHARMFVAGQPSYEDPATGSAAAAFVGAVLRGDEPPDGALALWIEQGIEMGRPSRIRLEIDIRNGAAARARIGGDAVVVGRGTIDV